MIRFSVIVNSRDDARFEELRQNLSAQLASLPHELFRISDAKSMGEGLNRGAAGSNGDWLIFMHDDVRIINDDAASAIVAATATCDMFGAAGTLRMVSGNWYDAGRPYILGHVIAPRSGDQYPFEIQLFGGIRDAVRHGIQALDGIFIACKRSLFDRLNGFDAQTYRGFVGYDVDFSFRASLLGAKIGIVKDLSLLHYSVVHEFSEAKMQEWEDAQAIFCRVFDQHFNKKRGMRTHYVVGLDTPQQGLEIMRSYPELPIPL